MKKLLLLLPVVLFLFGFSAGRIFDEKLKGLLQQFKTSEENAMSTIFSNISGPSFYIPNIRVLKDLALGERTVMVDAIGNNVKEYISSKDFIDKYNELRDSRKPSPPEKPKSAAQMKEEYKTNLQNSIKEMQKSRDQAPADQKSMFDEIIKSFEQQMKDIDNHENNMFSPELDSYSQQGYQMQMDQYNKELQQWELEYPADNPKPLVRKWINSFLEKSGNIDFNAQLKTEKGKQIFVNPDYERKDYQWKLYFRAGREPVENARKFAQAWLNELK